MRGGTLGAWLSARRVRPPEGPGEGKQFLGVVFRRATDVIVLHAVPLGTARIKVRRVIFAILPRMIGRLWIVR